MFIYTAKPLRTAFLLDFGKYSDLTVTYYKEDSTKVSHPP